MTTLSRKMRIALLIAFLGCSACAFSVKAQQANPIDIWAGTDVSINNPSKNVQWAGKTVKGLTIAGMAISTNDSFNPRRAKAVDVGNKWVIPHTKEKEVEFHGILMDPEANKYAPIFTGAFLRRGEGNRGNNEVPGWYVKAAPTLEYSDEHMCLYYTKKTGGTVTINHDKNNINKNEFDVDCPVGDGDKGNGDKSRNVRNFYDAASRYDGLQPQSFFEPRFAVTAKYEQPQEVDFISCKCKISDTCNGAVKVTIPFSVKVEAKDVVIRYPKLWLQDQEQHPEHNNVSGIARQEVGNIISLIKAHEEQHRADFATVITAVKGFSLEIDACGGSRVSSIQRIKEKLLTLVRMAEDDHYLLVNRTNN
ncbi:MAG: hypothetical protein LBU65_15990, partial [Planctomycetaceae bacterium]|nr:hypothetical protein [Planctomycetaceae bacterium]